MIGKTLAEIELQLKEACYLTEPDITMAIHLSNTLQKPLLIEGPAGVGKTEVAKVLATLLETELIRLQCYEGIDASQALYAWNYQHQLMHLKMQESRSSGNSIKESDLYNERFLLKRPVLKAILADQKQVLLIDEIDRSDEEFESFLLEVLSDWQISIPELGTLKARSKPMVILTSNSTRDLSDALRRRCMYLYIDYPSYDKELAIVKSKVPGIHKKLVKQICRFMEMLRQERLQKAPGVAETLDWARALAQLHIEDLDRDLVANSLGLVLKDWRDKRDIELSLSELLEKTGVQSKMS